MSPEVHVDAVRGHIRVGDLVFCDLGRTFNVWSYSGANLDPEAARALGWALVRWADKGIPPEDPWVAR